VASIHPESSEDFVFVEVQSGEGAESTSSDLSANSSDAAVTVNMFTALKISATSTRSGAKRNKKKSGLFGCARCMKMFANFKKVRSHVNNETHTVSSKALKSELKECERELARDPDCEMMQYNYKLALTKIAFLEKFSR